MNIKTLYKYHRCECGITINFYDLLKHIVKQKHTDSLNRNRKSKRKYWYEEIKKVMENKIKNMLGMKLIIKSGGFYYDIIYDDNGEIERCYEPEKITYKRYKEEYFNSNYDNDYNRIDFNVNENYFK